MSQTEIVWTAALSLNQNKGVRAGVTAAALAPVHPNPMGVGGRIGAASAKEEIAAAGRLLQVALKCVHLVNAIFGVVVMNMIL